MGHLKLKGGAVLALWIALAIIFVSVLLVGYQGRLAIVHSEQDGCVRSTLQKVYLANGLYADEVGDIESAHAKGQSPTVARIKLRVANVENQTIVGLDRLIDPRYDAGLNRASVTLIKSFGSHAFSCARAYRQPSFL